MANYCKLHQRDFDCHEEPEYVDYLPWWRGMATYVILAETATPRVRLIFQKEKLCAWAVRKEKISINCITGLAHYWPISEQALTMVTDKRTNVESNWGFTTDLTTVLLTVRCATDRKGKWQNSNCSSCTANTEGRMPTYVWDLDGVATTPVVGFVGLWMS